MVPKLFFVNFIELEAPLLNNIFEDKLTNFAEDFVKQGNGSKIILKDVPDPNRFGVAELSGDKVIGIEEKPDDPKTNWAVTGIYFYDKQVFDIIRTLKPSGRNELEITDVNNAYLSKNQMTYGFFNGWWTDAGTFESLRKADELAEKLIKE